MHPFRDGAPSLLLNRHQNAYSQGVSDCNLGSFVQCTTTIQHLTKSAIQAFHRRVRGCGQSTHRQIPRYFLRHPLQRLFPTVTRNKRHCCTEHTSGWSSFLRTRGSFVMSSKPCFWYSSFERERERERERVRERERGEWCDLSSNFVPPN